MVAYSPGAFFQAQASSPLADLSRTLGEALWLDELVTRFSDAIGLEGGIGHACFALREQRVLLFGTRLDFDHGTAANSLSFELEGWDQQAYAIDIALTPAFIDRQRRANLHAMAALYLFKGLALFEASDDVWPDRLTDREQFCLDQHRSGRCDLDIGEDLDRSALAVAVHLERAQRKLRQL